MTARRRVALALAIGLLAGPAVAACGGLPRSGPVQQGLGVDGPVVDGLQFLPVAPTPGASPVAIVNGFLRAGAGHDDQHAVARSYLAPKEVSTWQPGAQVTVLSDSSLRVTAAGADSVKVTASILATIDGAGRYRQMHVPRPLSARFGLERVRGQWRIASTPGGFGLWLSSTDLDRLYSAYAIYYAAPATKVLVPDIRWLPIGSGLATSLARAQLAPVPSYLDGAVVTGVTSGTQLALDAVPVQSTLATVDLSTPGLPADPRLRQALWAQFLATLAQVPGVGQVSLEVGGSAVALPGVKGFPSSPADVGYLLDAALRAGPIAVIRQGAHLERIDGDVIDRDDSANAGKGAAPALPQVGAGWVGLALSGDGSTIAAIGGDHADLAVWHVARQTVAPRFATQLTRPSFDTDGWLWTAGTPLSRASRATRVTRATGATELFTFDSSTKDGSLTPLRVSAPWLDGRRVLALRVSPDGQRAALATCRPDGSDARVLVAGVVRDGAGRPRSLAVPLRIGTGLTAASDLTWVDDRTLAVLGQAPGSTALRPFTVDLGGSITALAAVKGARWITSTGDERGILVMTDSGQVYERAGAGWSLQSSGSDVAVAGN